MDKLNITIIGGGVVGLAIAACLSKDNHDVALLESHPSVGQETSSRNSEVIHAGIYYPPGSLKAKTCTAGARLLYDYCQEHSVPHKRTGKLIVATAPDEIPALHALYDNARSNGVEGLSMLEGPDIRKLEPRVTAIAAIHSSGTGILNVHTLMDRLYQQSLDLGVTFGFNSKVTTIDRDADGYVVGIDDYRFHSRVLINSAGLYSDKVAALPGIDVAAAGYALEYSKGSYFSYAGESPVSMLVYPLPSADKAGLGLHATPDLNGRLRFGPDAETVSSIEFKVDASKGDVFFESASKYISGLDRDAFSPDMAGVRPVLKGGGRDFIIREESGRGFGGFINLIGIESPGLTASLSIAEHVKALITDL